MVRVLTKGCLVWSGFGVARLQPRWDTARAHRLPSPDHSRLLPSCQMRLGSIPCRSGPRLPGNFPVRTTQPAQAWYGQIGMWTQPIKQHKINCRNFCNTLDHNLYMLTYRMALFCLGSYERCQLIYARGIMLMILHARSHCTIRLWMLFMYSCDCYLVLTHFITECQLSLTCVVPIVTHLCSASAFSCPLMD